MTRSTVTNPFKVPLNKDAFHMLAIVGVLGFLLGATIGFLAVPQWKGAFVGAVLSIPGSLFAGVLSILFQWHIPTKRPSLLRMISSFAIIAVLIAAMVGLQQLIPSLFLRSIVVATVAYLIAAAFHHYRGKRGGYREI
ncbi:MAG: hypothetical protein CMJ78_14780 [Planctomycetaceae bacterium]|nr:hypothetical protein [Planctomycetaceae bacterium]